MNKPLKSSDTSLSRRQIMIGAAGFSFAFALGGRADAAVLAGERAGQTMSPWISIATDGTITIMSAATEMGQGSMTSLPLIIAEELDADWTKVKIVPAPAQDAIYGNPGFGGMMYTAGSNAVTSYYVPLRTAGAQVRRVLLDNAARKWAVPVAELSTEPSTVVHAKSGRRLSYGDIAQFAEVPAKAPEIKPEDLKKPADFRLIGQDVMRIELPLKVTGKATYGIDVQVPGMLYGTVLRAPVEGSVPNKIDEAKAKAVPGVVAVIRLPHGVGVVAETAWAALKARQTLNDAVTWTRTGVAWGFDSDKGHDTFAADAKNMKQAARDWSAQGNARAAFQNAASVVEGEFRCDYAYHAQMEPLNAVASVSPNGDAVEIWAGTQSQTTATEAPAKFLGISRDKVKLHDLLMGGGFGRRGNRDVDFIMDAVMLSKEVGKPVKSMWTREDDVHNGRFRPLSAHYLRAAFDAQGKLAAWHHRLAADRITPFMDPVRFQQGGGKDGMVMAGTDIRGYDVPHQLVEQLYRDTGVRTNPLRGIGVTANKYATEAFMDEVARKRGQDPLAFRLELLKDTPRAYNAVKRVAEMAEWGKKREGRALGLAYIDYSGSQVAGVAEVSLNRATGEIKMHNFWCTIDCGVAVQPDNIIAQTESSIVYGLGLSMTERISIKDGAVEQSNFYDYTLPRMRDVPQMHIELIKTDNHPTGAGQMATPLIAPCISNAVADMTGVRLRHTPFLPDRVKKALA
ncbi:xanthine dehydrogenase family protein molybdopterin-binding subunit [Rhodoplanes sp. Z2-YC6860]|uniref:xanthine dehydrogenase family protein molybdopterin-binding subunit n=1 Tax=Rhodoplanes sp. Z2-YC6860 TaxID=674703 RepID=UPI00078E6879|nr:molybdopterin cofactor-binding domain-containing protein [Rhodoplanes sp. Z2-YC6860]AMN41951.1 Isoquinoline 1-oxidoreductase [Rhodoplanes sp. Z2-YC6860]